MTDHPDWAGLIGGALMLIAAVLVVFLMARG
jgi:hypothetical protein